MKSLLTICLLHITILVCGQSKTDFKLIINRWTEGKLDSNGQVVNAPINRGGWKHLNINNDSTVVYSDGFTCGFGHEQKGKWALNKTNSTLIFHFDKRIGYMNTHDTTTINEIEVYNIELLTRDQLILKKVGQEKSLAFLKTEK